MLQTLFTIPNEIAGVPLFGFGLVAALWAAWCVVYAVVNVRRTGFNSELASSLGAMAAEHARASVWLTPSAPSEGASAPVAASTRPP